MIGFQFAESQQVVALANGAPFPDPCVALVGDSSFGVARYELSVQDGVPVVRRFSVDGEALTPQVIRDLSSSSVVDELVRQAAEMVVVLRRAENLKEQGVPYRFLDEGERQDLGRVGEQAMENRRPWRAVTPDRLRRVAEIVRANPGAPNKAVMAQMYTSQRNATRLIAEAKQRGFITEED